MKPWSKPQDINSQLKVQWDRGNILRDILQDVSLFPLRIKLISPTANEAISDLTSIIKWNKELHDRDKNNIGYGYELIEKEINYRLLGRNIIPTHAQIPTREDVIRMLKKQPEVDLFVHNVELLLNQWDILFDWIYRYPFKVINNMGSDCNKFIKVLSWFEQHSEHYLYLRQLDIPGVDTKFIETNSAVISELLTIILPAERVNVETNKFEERYYLKSKPRMIRFRILDESFRLQSMKDLSVPVEEFEEWSPLVETVYVTENEINFLSFPDVKNAIIIFGRGYGIDLFKEISWLVDKKIYYWGDIDTHGFNILSMARRFLPQIESFLMSEEILLAHRDLWVYESTQHLAKIDYLSDDEQRLVANLQNNVYGLNVRLEQERIAFSYVEKFLTLRS